MRTLFCGMGFPSCGQANEDATEGWANSQSYNLYRKIDCFYPQITQIICGLLSWDLGNSAGIFRELAGVIEPGQVFFQGCASNPCADDAEDLFLQPVTMIVALANG